jgi:hypothetical protein
LLSHLTSLTFLLVFRCFFVQNNQLKANQS